MGLVWQEIILATIAALGASAGFWKVVALGMQKKKKVEVERGLRSVARIFSKMEALTKHGADRVIVFAGHNNGGLPRITCGYWTSSVFSYFKPKHRERMREFTNIPVDNEYIKMLLEAQRQPLVRLRTSEMTGSQLKSIYEAEGILDSIVVYLGIHEKRCFYMSVATYEKLFSDAEESNILVCCQNIKTMFDRLGE